MMDDPNIKDSTWIHYDSTGIIMKTEVYKKGVLVQEKLND